MRVAYITLLPDVRKHKQPIAYNRAVECLSDNLEALVIITLTPLHAG